MAPVKVPAPRPMPPNQTLYVHNLEERAPIDHLKSHLETIFSPYGKVLDIIAKQSVKRKGQAFVVFESESAAAQALEDVQGFPLFDKPMVLEFARARSDAVVQATGDEKEFELHKRHRLAEKERKQATEAAKSEQTKLKRPTGTEAEAAPAAARPIKRAGLKSTGGAAAVIPDEYLPPNKTLFVQNVPDDYDVDSLSALFGRFEGFREVRLVPGRKGIAFVEYQAEAGAISAKERMANMTLGDSPQPLKVTYQRQ
ncbi:RNA recognition domain-containing protein [Microthyrium microscopicum]|uniref:RNA recognition domain-containing protein n=1 Tax=Microthyrium microscopicum TaxID=703497 RepID=A0A6A6UIW4_9PEZI|nr:RNA recognition domain-containing protein [Microthyrium microscopicum]